MADHRQDIFSRGLRFIGPCPFDLQPEVGILSLEREQAREGQLPLPALVSGSRIVLADRRLRAVLGKLEPRLHARGIAVSDAPVFGINDADVTVARPSLTLSPTASATLVGWDAGVRAGREPQAVQPGRYDLVGLLFDTELDEHEEPVPMSPRELLLSMLAQVPNLARVDGQETLNVLGRARDRAPQRIASWIFPERVAEAAAALLAIDS